MVHCCRCCACHLVCVKKKVVTVESVTNLSGVGGTSVTSTPVVNIPVATVTEVSGIVKLDVGNVKPTGVKWNNPLNIRISSNEWQGKLPVNQNKNGNFEEFTDLDYGVRAGVKNLTTYNNRGLNTLDKIINTWAPVSENNTKSYIDFVAKSLSVTSVTVLNLKDKGIMASLVSAMSIIEKGKNQSVPVGYVLNVIDRFNLL